MAKDDLSRFIRTDITKTETYVPVPSLWDLSEKYGQPVSKIIKLDAGENQYGVSEKVVNVIREMTLFNFYPDPEYKKLRKALTRYTGLKMENIIVGAGSDELIDLFLRLLLNPSDEIINCPPTFGMYAILAKLNRGIVISVPRKSDFSLDIASILKNISKRTKAIFICSPNNPTGNIARKSEMITLLKTGKFVVVDEAYYEFCQQTAVPLTKKYSNLIVLRTMSKWAGLAGLRIGYAIADPYLVKECMKIKLPFNVNLLAEQAGIAALSDRKFAKTSIQTMLKERKRVYDALQDMPGIQVYWSYGNFLFVQVPERDYKLFQDAFEKNNIVLRYYPSIRNGVRITIGTKEQNNRILEVFRKIGKKRKIAFLDRDGTLIFEPQDTLQIDSLKKLRILDGVMKGLSELTKQGYDLVMVTNQNGLGTPSFPQANFDAPQNELLRILKDNGITFKKILICPHTPSKNCDCRKPKIGLVKKMFRDSTIDKNKSFICGDRETDSLFAKNLGIRFIPMQTNANFYQALKQRGIII